MSDFTQAQRRKLAQKNQAMPDGGFPIRNVSDLKNAIRAYGRATNKPAVKAWIKKRAKELDSLELLPENWRVDTIKHTDDPRDKSKEERIIVNWSSDVMAAAMFRDIGMTESDINNIKKWLEDKGYTV